MVSFYVCSSSLALSRLLICWNLLRFLSSFSSRLLVLFCRGCAAGFAELFSPLYSLVLVWFELSFSCFPFVCGGVNLSLCLVSCSV